MMPVTPDIQIRILEHDDGPALESFLNPLLLQSPYSRGFDVQTIIEQVLQPEPYTVYSVRWQQNRPLGAWRAGQLVGFLDTAIGFDSDNLAQPDYEPLAILRFLALPEREDLVEQVAICLLHEAERFWEMADVQQISAFHLSTGYPAFQAGAGILPSDWSTHFRILTAHDYQLAQRYSGMIRTLDQPIDETMTVRDLSLEIHGSQHDRRYELYYRRVDHVASARMLSTIANEVLTVDQAMRFDQEAYAESENIGESHERFESMNRAEPISDKLSGTGNIGDYRKRVAHITELFITESWRGYSLGRLLLRRLINDAILLEFDQMLVYLPQGADVAWSLLTQQGFYDANYRGYAFKKQLKK